MKIKMSNEQMAQNVDVLRSVNEKGKLGYAIMRNARKLSEASTEYRKIKDEAIRKYGDKTATKDGRDYYAVPPKRFKEYLDEIKDIAMIEEEVDVFTVSEEEFYSGNLTSRQMDALFWMMDNPDGGGVDGNSGI